MNTKIITLLLSIIYTSLSAQIKEDTITLATKTGNIKGTITYTTAPNKTPVALIIAGSGPTDRNGNNPMMTNNSLKMLADELGKNGIATVRYDKRGIAESKSAGLKEIDLRFENYIDDARAWVNLLKNDNRFSEIIIIGHSEGALIGMIAAQEKEVDKFISLEGSGVPATELLREQLKAQPPTILNPSLPIIDKLEKGQTTDDVPPMLYALFRSSVQPYLISWFKYNPQKEIAKLDKSILIIQGTTDIQVSVTDAKKLYAANKNAEKQIIEGMNHILKASEADRLKNIQTYSNPDLPLKDGLIKIIIEFISRE